jgi:UPF0271 protein
VNIIDLSADVGESFGEFTHGDDDRLIPLISSANIACGFHAGDPRVMQRTVRKCAEFGVSVGGHPGFADLFGFGRRDIAYSAQDVYVETLYQLGSLRAIAAAEGLELAHVSPHGRLGNLVQSRADLAEAVAKASCAVDADLVLMGLAGELAREGRRLGLTTATTGFVDRAYQPDGSLVSRSVAGAVLEDPGEIAERAVRLVIEGRVRSVSGADISLQVDSLLLHGDNPTAVAIATRVRQALDVAGVRIAPVRDVLRSRAGVDGR